MPAIRVPLLVATCLSVVLFVITCYTLFANPAPVDAPRQEPADEVEASDESADAGLDAEVDAEPSAEVPAEAHGEAAADRWVDAPDGDDPVLAGDEYEDAVPAEESFVKPKVSRAPDAAVRFDAEGRVSSSERRRWGLEEERARCLREMRAKYGWEPGEGALSADRLRLRFDADTRLAYYDRREADGTWRRFWPEDERAGLRFDPRPDDAGAERVARAAAHWGLGLRAPGPWGRYRSAPYIPGLRLDDGFGLRATEP